MISNLPTDRSVDSNTCDTTTIGTCIITWDDPLVMDNSGMVTVSSNYAPSASFPFGNTNVIFTANDQSGNQATASFLVTIIGKLKVLFERKSITFPKAMVFCIF